MKKILFASALFTILMSCNNNSGDGGASSDSANNNGMGNTKPSAIDTTKHPDGIINGSVISTDTAAMTVENQNMDTARKRSK